MAVAELSSNDLLLVALLGAIVVQGIAANITNVYTAGLSFVNTIPRLGRVWATVVMAALALGLSAFPDLVEEARKWIVHLGNLGAPFAGVVLADYLVLPRQQLEVEGLFDPHGRYRYLKGVNVFAVVAVAIGVAVYCAVPPSWIKVVWGLSAAAAAYLALAVLRTVGDTDTRATAQRPSSFS